MKWGPKLLLIKWAQWLTGGFFLVLLQSNVSVKKTSVVQEICYYSKQLSWTRHCSQAHHSLFIHELHCSTSCELQAENIYKWNCSTLLKVKRRFENQFIISLATYFWIMAYVQTKINYSHWCKILNGWNSCGCKIMFQAFVNVSHCSYTSSSLVPPP